MHGLVSGWQTTEGGFFPQDIQGGGVLFLLKSLGGSYDGWMGGVLRCMSCVLVVMAHGLGRGEGAQGCFCATFRVLDLFGSKRVPSLVDGGT
jgi:hypothetical protein